GIKLWRAGGALQATPRTDAVSAVRMLGHAWLVTALNPKSITFFVAFLPAFLDAQADFLTQMLVVGRAFLVLGFANALTYALVASRARGLVSDARAIGAINKVGGGLLITAGAATVTFAGSKASRRSRAPRAAACAASDWRGRRARRRANRGRDRASASG